MAATATIPSMPEAPTPTSSSRRRPITQPTSTATDLDSSFVETYASFIQNSTTIPHATVLATASGGLEYYRFTVTAGATAVFDIDQTTPGLDTYLELFSTDGTTLLTTADDSRNRPRKPVPLCRCHDHPRLLPDLYVQHGRHLLPACRSVSRRGRPSSRVELYPQRITQRRHPGDPTAGSIHRCGPGHRRGLRQYRQ